MKLNLLPTHVSKEGQTKIATILSGVIALGAIAAGIFMVAWSSNELSAAKQRVEEAQPAYEQAVNTSKRADEIMASSVVINRNLKLAEEMEKHTDVYPDLYREVLGYVPSFFRVYSIRATPNGAQSCTVTMQGVLQSFQQYADIMLALLRIKDATNVTRSGFTSVRKVVPALNEQDQFGLPVLPGQPNLPSDPRAKLDELVSRAGPDPTAFQGINGFGQPVEQKGAMPDWSDITVTVTLSRNIQTPNPRATLTSQGAATATPAAGGSTTGGGAQNQNRNGN
ncbi:MAG: hypothetical protein JNM34_05805 [Chthonomonadaceae bacterium]|nr:hypothetical protein [Chthonomonadaceae bacterium]